MARYSQFEAPPSVALQCAPIDECLPGFEAAHPMPLMDAAVHPKPVAGQRVPHAGAHRRAGQPRLRRRRPPPLHAVPARAGAQPLHRPAGLHARRRAGEPGVAEVARLRALPALSRGAGRRAGGRARAGRRAVHPGGVVAPRRVVRRAQRARQLLVAAGVVRAGRSRLADEVDAARAAEHAPPARGAPQGMGGDCSRTSCSRPRPMPPATFRQPGRACWASCRRSASRPCWPAWRRPRRLG